MFTLSHAAALVVLLLVASLVPCFARAAEPMGPSMRLRRPDQLELAHRSTTGPGWEIASGALLVASTPIVAGFAALAAGPTWRDCSYGASDARATCQRAAQADARRWGFGMAVPMLAMGSGLLGHGGLRLRRIREARRELSISGASVSFKRGGAIFGVKVAF
jgi:hypothetical protein